MRQVLLTRHPKSATDLKCIFAISLPPTKFRRCDMRQTDCDAQYWLSDGSFLGCDKLRSIIRIDVTSPAQCRDLEKARNSVPFAARLFQKNGQRGVAGYAICAPNCLVQGVPRLPGYLNPTTAVIGGGQTC